MAMSAANQVSVSHAALLLRHSFHVTTPVMSSTARPTSALATAFTPKSPPLIHSATVTANAAAVIFSSVLMGPSLSSCFCASMGASGVSFFWGGLST